MDRPNKLRVSDVLQEITSKKNWYSKVFDTEITQKWADEIKEHSTAYEFNLALSILKASTQGSVYIPNCEWDDYCHECHQVFNCKIKDAVFRKDNSIDSDDEIENFEDEDIEELIGGCNHKRCKCISPDNELHDYIVNETNHDVNLNEALLKVIWQMRSSDPVDYHPGSNNQVIDIIHPSVNCYAQGITKHIDGSVGPKTTEDKMYYWLPAEFDVNSDGKVKLCSRINNLDNQRYPEFDSLIEKVVENRLSSLEKVTKKNLKNRRIQIVVKIASIELTSNNPKYDGGSWHTEGMPYEQICATVIEYLQIKNITESFLEFRKPTYINDEDMDYPQNDHKYTAHHYGLTAHHDGKMNRYLGLIKCNENSFVVFPNTLQHRVKDFEIANHLKTPHNTSFSTQGLGQRTILALFVIDPDNRIISTQDVPVSTWTKDQIDYHRERLMFHRKYFVKQLNKEIYERPYSLCEH
jgi:hypothetical protein